MVYVCALVSFSPFVPAEAGTGNLARVIPAGGNVWHVDAADITGDDRLEVVYACYNGDICCQRDDTGELLWKYATGACQPPRVPAKLRQPALG